MADLVRRNGPASSYVVPSLLLSLVDDKIGVVVVGLGPMGTSTRGLNQLPLLERY